ncbi:MAG: gliding motility-associated C-terminal domain-containing protein [Chitinophagaceae bacterium]|nr:gliding motility-associated C-terminal domain-containing protein [Chitinophagaceae bacterium]
MNTRFTKNLGRHFSLTKKLLCAGALLLGSQISAEAQWVKIGTGTTSNTATTYPTPFGNLSRGQKAFYIYPGAELAAAGLKPGFIDSLAFLVTDVNKALGHTDLRFFVGSGPGTATGTLTDGDLRFYDPLISYLPTLGWNTFGFRTPYYWNGTDNIMVSTCFYAGVGRENASVEWSDMGTAILARTYATSSSSITAVCGDKTSGVTHTFRPNIRFMNRKDTCLGKPDAGFAVSTAKQFCLKDDSMELNLVRAGLGYGLSFQWQSSPSLDGTWVNIGTASTTKVEKKVIQTESSYYRCILTCIASGTKDTSVPIYVPMAPPYNCDCISESKSNKEEKVLSVSLAGMTNYTPCAPSAGLYSDFTSDPAVPPVALEPGTEYTLTMRLGSCDPTTTKARAVKVFIDYNQNTDYEVSEMVYANTYSALQPNPQTAIGNFTVPLPAKKGLTTMRIVYAQEASLSDVKPCGQYNFGETQDYAINILQFGKPTVTGRLKVCQYDSVVMNASSVADTPVIFTWTGPGGFTGIGPKITFVNADPSLSGTYYVTATSKGRTSTPRAVEVVVYPKPPVPNVLNANICQYEADGKLKTDGKNVLWYNVPVGGFGDTVAPTVPTHTPNTATFYLTQTVNGCVSDRTKVVVNVILKPSPPVVKSPVTYCQLQEPDLAAKGENLKWYLDSAGGVASTISPTPPVGFPDEIDYYVSQTINGCESDRARVRVIVYEQPNGIILHSKPYVCQYDTASFEYFGNAPASYDYKWFSTNGTLESGGGQGPVVFRFNDTGNNIVSLFVNNGKCATFRIADTITTRMAPSAVIDTVFNACVGVPVTITIDSATPNATNYQWQWDGGTVVSENIDGGPYSVVWNTAGPKELGLIVSHRNCPSLPIKRRFFINDRPIAKITSIRKITDNGHDTAFITGKICSRDTLIFTAFKDTTYKYKWYPEYYFERDTVSMVADRMRAPGYISVRVTNDAGCIGYDSTYVRAESCCELSMPSAFTPNGDAINDRFRPLRDGRQDIVTFRIVNRWGQVVYESANTDLEGWDGSFAGRPQDMGVYQYYIKYRCLDGSMNELKGDITLIR